VTASLNALACSRVSTGNSPLRPPLPLLAALLASPLAKAHLELKKKERRKLLKEKARSSEGAGSLGSPPKRPFPLKNKIISYRT
jgi:hypothetical protein